MKPTHKGRPGRRRVRQAIRERARTFQLPKPVRTFDAEVASLVAMAQDEWLAHLARRAPCVALKILKAPAQRVAGPARAEGRPIGAVPGKSEASVHRARRPPGLGGREVVAVTTRTERNGRRALRSGGGLGSVLISGRIAEIIRPRSAFLRVRDLLG